MMQPMSQIYALAFAEAGNAFMSWQDFDPFTLKRSLGIGVRIYLPYVGLIGVDWGYGFDKSVGADKPHGGQVHFMMGMQF
jgi:outer membrane protein insertion porin family